MIQFTNATALNEVLYQYTQTSTSSRNKGDKFEDLVVAFLKTDPQYQDLFSDVWLWMEYPDRGNRTDTGIDIVAKERATGDLWAIQCKFYDPSQRIMKEHIDSFFTASGVHPYKRRMIVSTTNHWSKHAEDALRDQQIPVTRLTLKDLADSPVDWSRFNLETPQALPLKPKKQLRPHQASALEAVMAGFETEARGRLIMACGTGKTFTSLKIAERFVSERKSAHVLFLVPSIALLSQSLREWTAEAEGDMHTIAVCSDSKVSKKRRADAEDDEDISTHDLSFPATTKPDRIADLSKRFDKGQPLKVVFSTYQSIEAVYEAQQKGLPKFDLIICDEAHRTTGVTRADEEASHFVRVHDKDYLQADKRLYMTATPRLYTDTAKTKAEEGNVVLASMDDEATYGREFYRLNFGEAINQGLLTDYKVMILAVDEKHVSKAFQAELADKNNELDLSDAVKITGCWNGLSKRFPGEDGKVDTAPMRRAVAFSGRIKDSKLITDMFAAIVNKHIEANPDDGLLRCEIQHVDGTQNALERNAKLDWLKADMGDDDNVCRILSNARCLSEGVDVPALDAVMFLTPRSSVVDVVQSVGRVMRKLEGKDYGYIILPIGIPADKSPEEALQDNERYKVVWQVLQALRAHDDRFNATVNKIELNKHKPKQVNVIGVGQGREKSEGGSTSQSNTVFTMDFPNLDEWRDAIYAKIVDKVGDRRYWESWAKDVAEIADRNISRIKALLDDPTPEHQAAFDGFLKGLRENINPNVEVDDAIEMLAQHLITKPVFDALFDGYDFAKFNPVSQAMQGMLETLEGQAIDKELASLESFYESVRERASNIDNAAGKQKVIIELYDKFFKTAFPRLVDRLGIVYTPVEVVDFIVHSADHALRQEFGVGLTDEGVHVLDPFTGTGTFLARLIQSDLVRQEDLARKFKHELHANEIVLLAYYIAAVNIEATYHDKAAGDYQPFEGIVLTDTFQMFEHEGTMNEEFSPENNQRVLEQRKKDITVIMANPPYSAGQTSENDNNKNIKYPQLESAVRQTYAALSSATNKNGLYASEILAMRWASDRITKLGDRGIVCYVTNGSFIDSNVADGLRATLTKDFSSIYCFNLRGNQRTSGERSRQEGGKIFGSGSRAPIAIIMLIKNPNHVGDCQLYYHDIGDYLSREEKLERITDFKGIQGINWQRITPNEQHDWINQRDPAFDAFVTLGDKKDDAAETVFEVYSSGIKTNRDTWAYNFSRDALTHNMGSMIDFYNEQVTTYQGLAKKPSVDKFINTDARKISWSGNLKNDLGKGKKYKLEEISATPSMYRPFCKQWLYFNRRFNERVYQMPKIFPNEVLENLAISVTGLGVTKDFNAIIVNVLPDIQLQANGQCFPLHTYHQTEETDLFAGSDGYTRQDNIANSTLANFRWIYSDTTITKEDVFYYVYGILHSLEYKTRFAADLKKMLPRIPYAQDFWAFSKAGRTLAEWHLNYETIEPYPLNEQSEKLPLEPAKYYRVEKMSFAKSNIKGQRYDKTIIYYNNHITLSNIPLEAYEYVVNGKPAVEWVMERYQVTKDKNSGIVNDPNMWSDDPRYILDLVKRVVRVSVETVKIVDSLPPLNERSADEATRAVN